MTESHHPTPAVEVHPATAERWADLEALFGSTGACGGCWCMFWRLPSGQFQDQRGAENQAALLVLAASDMPPGVLAYADDRAIGWCAIGRRTDFVRLARSRNLRPIDEQPVWSIVCFFVAKPYRRRGVSLAQINGAVQFARAHGAQIVEAYPLDLQAPRYAGQRLSGAAGYEGSSSAFQTAGFREVKRASATQLIMRYVIGSEA
jgi:GNAT superfamily N-acetyltransferase